MVHFVKLGLIISHKFLIFKAYFISRDSFTTTGLFYLLEVKPQ